MLKQTRRGAAIRAGELSPAKQSQNAATRDLPETGTMHIINEMKISNKPLVKHTMHAELLSKNGMFGLKPVHQAEEQPTEEVVAAANLSK